MPLWPSFLTMSACDDVIGQLQAEKYAIVGGGV